MVKPLRFAVGTRSVGRGWLRKWMEPQSELVLGGTSTGNQCDFNKSNDELPFLSSLSKFTEKKHAKIGYVFLVDLHTLYIWMVKPVSHICCLKPQWFLDLKSWLVPDYATGNGTYGTNLNIGISPVKQQLGSSRKTAIIHDNPPFVNNCPNSNGDSPLPDPNWPKYGWKRLKRFETSNSEIVSPNSDHLLHPTMQPSSIWPSPKLYMGLPTQKGKSWGFVLGDVWHSLYSYFDRLRQVAPQLCKKKQKHNNITWYNMI